MAKSCLLRHILLCELLVLSLHVVVARRGASVAIIGSGIGGSSAAHFLKSLSEDYAIHVFEKESHVCGRAHSPQYDGSSFEAGAAVIHIKNEYLKTFAKDLGLKMKIGSYEDKDGLSIFDGVSTVF